MTLIKFNQNYVVEIEHVSGREVTITSKKGVITVSSDAYNENFNDDKRN